MQYRVVLFLTVWLVLWVALGTAVASLFHAAKTGMVIGFALGLLSTFLWPWIVPDPLDRWMDGRFDERAI